MVTLDDLDTQNAAATYQNARSGAVNDGSNDALNNINVSDFGVPTNPGELPMEAYYPGPLLSPARLQLQQWGDSSLPISTGGNFYLPYAAIDARQRALQNAAYFNSAQLDKKKLAVSNLFPMLAGEPPYQSQANQEYGDKIFSAIQDVWNKHGKNAVNILSDPNNPITQNIFSHYLEYESHVDAIKQAQGNIESFVKAQKEGYEPSQSTWDLVNKYYSGDATKEDLQQLNAGTLRNYQTLDNWMKENHDAIKQTITDEFHKGLPVVDDKGNTTYDNSSIAGSKVVTQVKKKMLSEDQLTNTAAYLKDHHIVDPNMPLEDIKKYLKSEIGDNIESTLHNFNYPSTFYSGSGPDKNKMEVVTPVDNAPITASLNHQHGSSGAVNVLRNTTGSFVSAPSIRAYPLAKYNIKSVISAPPILYNTQTNQKETPNQSVLSANISGLYDYYTDQNGKIIFQGQNKQMSPDYAKQQGYTAQRFALVKYTGDDKVEKQGLIPYTQEIANELTKNKIQAPDLNPIEGGGAENTPTEKTIVKTGTFNGKKVVQYSDGTTEYAK